MSAGARRALVERIEVLRALIRCMLTYIDTVHALVPHRLCQPDYAAVAAECRHLGSYPAGCRTVYRLQMPSAAALEMLARLCPDHRITRVDVALDLITATPESAARLAHELRLLVTQPRHGRAIARNVKSTRYIAPGNRRRNLIIYSDRPSKINGLPCAHIELRYKTTRSCRRRGINSLSDIPQFKPSEFFNRDIRFSLIDFESLNRRFRRAAELQIPNNPAEQIRLIEKLQRIICMIVAGYHNINSDKIIWGSTDTPAQTFMEFRQLAGDPAVAHVPFLALLRPAPDSCTPSPPISDSEYNHSPHYQNRKANYVTTTFDLAPTDI